MEKYARFLLPEAKKELASLKADIEVKEAELKKKIRSKPSKYGIEKVTEAAINEALLTHQLYLELQQTIIEATYVVDMLSGAVKTLDDRRRGIEGAISLHGQGYFAKPRIDGDNRDMLDSVEKASRRSSTKPLKRKKRGKNKGDEDSD